MTLVASMLVFVLGFQVTASFKTTATQRSTKKQSAMTADQRIAHVLSRLTYGARPGDFEKVKAMGVEAFINQQLDPDSIDNSTAIAKLRRLPTLRHGDAGNHRAVHATETCRLSFTGSSEES